MRAGHLRVIGLLGRGGMGEVYLGFDERLQRRVALKVIRHENRLSAGSRERLLREARVLSALDHPNICRIYDYAEGPVCDFLVLELIEGITLRQAVEQGLSRTRKLRIARDAVRALAAAHRRGIVHRDLKPDNIMIAAGGTVKVLDFGLARAGGAGQLQPDASGEDLDAADTWIFAAPEAATTAPAGTPLYMSPEQARGATITTASDLYSFGLVLQMLLTEQPPRPADAGRDELLRLASTGERLPMRDQPRDLTALVARLTTLAPAERPTAFETLERIDRILATPARRARSAAAAVIAALLLAGVTKYVVDVGRARTDAQHGRRRAEELVAFMVNDLPKRLEPVGRVDLLDSTAAKALQYFTSLRAPELTGDELHGYAVALTQLGDVRLRQGKLPEALAMFRQSLRFAAEAAAQDPARDEWQLSLSNSHFWLADALRRKGDALEALPHFRAYYDISVRLAAKHPHDPRYETELSYGHSNLGSAYEALGDFARARMEYEMAVEIDRRRAGREPGGDAARADLANSLNKLGVLLQAGGELTGAHHAFQEDVETRRALVASRPEDLRRLRQLATSLAYLGVLQLTVGDVDGAVASDREDLAISTRLATADPQNLDWQRNRAMSQLRLAGALGSGSESAEVGALLDAALRTMSAIVASDARPAWQRDLAAAYLELSRWCARRNDLVRASEHGRRAVALAERAHAHQAADLASIRLLCGVLTDLGDVEELQGRTADARARREQAIALAAPPFDRDPYVSAAAARALVALGRPGEAAPLLARLQSIGFRLTRITNRSIREERKSWTSPNTTSGSSSK